MSVGENIKALRESRGLTQAQLADIVGVSDKAVSTWESGKREPRMGVVERLAAYFNVDKSTLLFGDGDHWHRLPGGWGSSSYIVDTLMSDPPSREVVEPILDYYGSNNVNLSDTKQALHNFVDGLTEEKAVIALRVLKAALTEEENTAE